MKTQVTLRDIEAAEQRIRKYLPPTPLEYSRVLSRMLGKEVYLKLEVFQPVRVFKIRGALNKVLSLNGRQTRGGVITASSGNHGLAVAYASRMFDIKAIVYVPRNANPQKVGAILEQGAQVVRAGSTYDEAYAAAMRLASKRCLTFVHAYDDSQVIAGQGTCGLEILRQVKDPETVIVSIGGGGLISGICVALKGALEGVSIYGVQARASPSMRESISAGRRILVRGRTIADGMQAMPGRLTFDIVSKHVEDIFLVSDRQIEDAMLDLILRARLLVEPAGAAPLAAAKNSPELGKGGKLILVVSGGNVALSLLSRVLHSRKGAEGISRDSPPGAPG